MKILTLGVNLGVTLDLGGKGANGPFGQDIVVRRRHIKLSETRTVRPIKEPSAP